MKNNKGSLRNLWDNMKCNDILIIGVKEREEKEQKTKNLHEETMTENSPKM